MAEQVKKFELAGPAETGARPDDAATAEHLFTAKMQHEHLAAAFKNWESEKRIR